MGVLVETSPPSPLGDFQHLGRRHRAVFVGILPALGPFGLRMSIFGSLELPLLLTPGLQAFQSKGRSASSAHISFLAA